MYSLVKSNHNSMGKPICDIVGLYLPHKIRNAILKQDFISYFLQEGNIERLVILR